MLFNHFSSLSPIYGSEPSKTVRNFQVQVQWFLEIKIQNISIVCNANE